MTDVAIQVENLGKRYRIGPRLRYKALRDTLAEAIYAPFRRMRSKGHRSSCNPARNEGHIWALKDVSLQINHGEVVGIIGPNGAGKTTLLKILSRITEPTEGYVKICGRVGSLLEVGTGFHPELTGRENIYLNGAILGMKKAEIDRKFDEIVAFAEVEKFIDTPVKHYSSGMYVRLAFAVAAHLEPEILLVDEVLAVGDTAFQKKCLGKMGDAAQEGRTILFVSHNMAAIISLCSRAFLLSRGRLKYSGTPQEVIGKYMEEASIVSSLPLTARSKRKGDGSLRFTSISIENSLGDKCIRCSDRLRIKIEYICNSPVSRASFLIRISDQLHRPIYLLDSAVAGGLPDILPLTGTITCITSPLNLPPGLYYINLAALAGGVLADQVKQACSFEVAADDYFGTGKMVRPHEVACLLKQEWQVAEDSLPRRYLPQD